MTPFLMRATNLFGEYNVKNYPFTFEPVWVKALLGYTHPEDIQNALMYDFTWSKTPQGHAFWAEMHTAVKYREDLSSWENNGKPLFAQLLVEPVVLTLEEML